jgi:hypothetical protein
LRPGIMRIGRIILEQGRRKGYIDDPCLEPAAV